METPEYLFPNGTLWDEWRITTRVRGDDEVLRTASEHKRSLWYKDEFDSVYPGFCSAFETLTAMGCDEYFVTSVLKFSIMHAENESLDTYLNRTRTLSSVQTALTIGLTSDDLVTLLSHQVPDTNASSLPEDFGYNADP